MGLSTCVRQVVDLLDRTERRRATLLFGMIFVMAFLELVGVALILPFISLLSHPSAVQESPYLRHVYDALAFSSHRQFLVSVGVVVFVQMALANCFKAYTTSRILRFSYGLGHSISFRLLRSYMGRPYEWFLTQNSANLSKIILSEVNQVVKRTILPLLQVCSQGFLAFVLLVFLIVVDPVLAIVAACVLAGAYGAIYFLLRHYILRMANLRLAANQRRFQIAHEILGGVKDVKAACSESLYLSRFEDSSRTYASCEANSQIASQLPRYALESVGFGGILVLALYLFLTRDALEGALQLLVLYAVAGYRLLPTLQNIFQNVASVRFGAPSLEVLHRDTRKAQAFSFDQERVASPPRIEFNDRVVLRDVHYCYPLTTRPTLKGMSVDIRARTIVAFVGATGAGKTTAIDILLGLLSPSQGAMQADGVAITEKNQRSWRRSVGYVPQHVFLSDDSVEANIAFGIPPSEVDRAALVNAAKAAQIHEFISNELVDGYSTQVGERGVRLSGGQRQRIGIARALYSDPTLLILDEATSALDSATEASVMEAIQALGREKTIVMVAHRMTTVKNCDVIHVITAGQISTSGTYEELLRGCEQFRALALEVEAI